MIIAVDPLVDGRREEREHAHRHDGRQPDREQHPPRDRSSKASGVVHARIVTHQALACHLGVSNVTAEAHRGRHDPRLTRGEEVSVDAIEHPAFVGHRFKASLLPVQQAIMAFAIGMS